ncbi:MAG: S10 family peptidase [Oligoflexus sp.]
MTKRHKPWLRLGLCISLLLTSCNVSELHANNSKQSEEENNEMERRSISSRHRAEFHGDKHSYTARAFETFLNDEKGQPKASIFAVSYTLDKVKDTNKRPITFIFNGGPGSSSVWLHMGLFGPKRIRVPSDGQPAGAAPYVIEDNPQSLLAHSDLVFIDPVGTGYSRTFGEHKASDYWGIIQDAEAITSFIRTYLTEEQRWNSPRYLAGESYGTVRASVLANMMQSNFTGITVNGVILISAILDFQAGRFTRGNDTPHVTFLPSYAATAWHHKKLPEQAEDLESFLDEVREFARTDYLTALFKGNLLSSTEEEAIIDRLHAYTGLSKNYIKQTNLRIHAHRFMKELLREEGKTIGRFDSRYLGKDYDDAGETFDNDASAYGIDGAYVASINHYFSHDLKVNWTDEYQILNTKVGRSWEWSLEKGKPTSQFINVAPLLGKAMVENPDLRVYVANGYYDLATPFYSTEYALSRHGIDPERLDMSYFQAGHMMYTHEPSFQKLTKELGEFYQQGPKPPLVSH